MTTALSRHEPYFNILFVRGIRVCTKGLLVAIADEPELGLRNTKSLAEPDHPPFLFQANSASCKLITVICTPALKLLYNYLLVDVPYLHTAEAESYRITPCRDSYCSNYRIMYLIYWHSKHALYKSSKTNKEIG